MPLTAVLVSAAIMASLRQAAADGPVVTELDAHLVVIELDGQNPVEHPLLPAGGDTRPEPPGCM